MPAPLPAAAEALARDAAAGRRLVIASASHSYYVHAIAARMGIADVVATEAVAGATSMAPASIADSASE